MDVPNWPIYTGLTSITLDAARNKIGPAQRQELFGQSTREPGIGSPLLEADGFIHGPSAPIN
jgi:hypothetical protein